MAEETSTAPPVEAPAPVPTSESVEAAQTNGDTSAAPKEDEKSTDEQPTTEVTAPEPDTTEPAEPSSATGEELEVMPPSNSKQEKRKSTGGATPAKKLNKKKSMPTLHLDCKPGEHYWAKLKGYPKWPSIICDEQMLPESLLATRPVSTARPDGSIRDDFKEGGKNAKERTYPVMFLATNEFTWIANTDLVPLYPEDCKELPKSKMTKALTQAWNIAAEGHDLAYFKGILKTWQEEEAQIEKERAEEEERFRKEEEERKEREKEETARAAADAAEGKKKKSRKSKGGDGDVDMADADAPKSSKKRKNENDADGAKKTPKVTKLNAPKTPNGEDSGKKSTAKSKKKVVQAPKADEGDTTPQMTEAEQQEQRRKTVLYLRHKLQKGFISREDAPAEAEMAGMSEFISQLEAYENLDPWIIRDTKVHKVLKAIVKLAFVPKDEVYNIKKRSTALLETWNKSMDNAPATASESKKSAPAEKKESAAPETNGEKSAEPAPSVTPAAADPVKEETETKEGAEAIEHKAEEAAENLEEKVEEVIEEKKEPAEEATPAAPEEPRSATDVLKDITMTEAEPSEEQAKHPQPAESTDAEAPKSEAA